MKIQIEDYNGNDILSFEIKDIKYENIFNYKNCNLADVDLDKTIRIQYSNK